MKNIFIVLVCLFVSFDILAQVARQKDSHEHGAAIIKMVMLQNNVFKKKQKCCLYDGMNRIRRNYCFSCFSNHLDILRMHRFSRSWLSNINFENYALCFVSLNAQRVLWCFHAGLEPAVCFQKK